MIITLFYNYGNLGLERLSKLPRVTQPVVGFKPRPFPSWYVYSYSVCHCCLKICSSSSTTTTMKNCWHLLSAHSEPDLLLHAWFKLFYLILTTVLLGGYYYYWHFTDEWNWGWDLLSDMPKIMWWWSSITNSGNMVQKFNPLNWTFIRKRKFFSYST